MRKPSERIAQLLIWARWPLLFLAAMLAVIAYRPASKLDFDRSIEKMFADDDPLLPPYFKLKETFGGNEVVLVVYTDEGLFDPDGSGIERLAGITERLKEVPGVKDVLSLAEINRVLDSIRALDILRRFDKLCIVDPDSVLGHNFRELFEKYTHGSDDKTVAAVCMLYPQSESETSREQTVEQLREVAKSLPDELGETWVVGEPAMVVDGFHYVEQDGQRLGFWTTILLGITILLLFRSLRWVIIPLAVVQLAVLLTKATLVVADLDLSMVSSMLTAIVTVTGIATVVHITVRFRDARNSGLNPPEALQQAGGILVAPVFWSCMTTAVGFGSLLFAAVEPIQDFGLMMAIGSLFVLFCVACVVPGLTLLGRIDADPHKAWGEAWVSSGLRSVIAAVERAPWSIGIVSVVSVSVAVYGTRWLEVETDFTKNFRSHTPIVQSYQFVENHLGGAGVWDVLLPAPKTEDNASLTPDYLQMVRRLEQRLRELPQAPVVDEHPLPAGWQRYDAAFAGFSAAFPVEPEIKSIRNKHWLWRYRFAAKNPETGATYIVTCNELSAEALADGAQSILNESRKQVKDDILDEQTIRIDDSFALEVTLKSMRIVAVVHDNRLYQLIVRYGSDERYPAHADAFFDSFRFVDPALTKVVSVADADQAIYAASALAAVLPPRTRLGRMQRELTTFYKSMLNTDVIDGPIGYLRVMLRAPERQPAAQKLALIDRVQDIVAEEMDSQDWRVLRASLRSPEELREQIQQFLFASSIGEDLTETWLADHADQTNNLALLRQTDEFMTEQLDEAAFAKFLNSLETPTAETTGFFVLLTNLISSILRDQWVCFGIATVAIAVMMTIAFRSPILALIALVPNALPILMVFGLMGWMGLYNEQIKMNMGAAMIAAVSMGLSVDSSIHYITSFRRARSDGKTIHESLDIVQQSVGRAAIFSTVALVVGFTILITSNFVPTIYFGVLVGLSMLGGLFGNLLVLPLLLRLVTRDR